MTSDAPHIPVLLRETVELLRPAAGGVFVDCTVGAGGHADAILEASSPDGRLLGIDRDPAAVALAQRRLARFGGRARIDHGDYRYVVDSARSAGFFAVDGIVDDLGVSSMQLDESARGFSFRGDGPLYMRMDPLSGEPTAADLLETLPETEIRRILRAYGEERLATELRGWLAAKAAANFRFLHQMAENALRNNPPLGLVRAFAVASEGEHKGTIDLKLNGASIFVDAARVFALAPIWSAATRIC